MTQPTLDALGRIIASIAMSLWRAIARAYQAYKSQDN